MNGRHLLALIYSAMVIQSRRAARQRWRARNISRERARVRACNRKRYTEKRDVVLAECRTYRAKNRAKVAGRKRAYRNRKPEVQRAASKRYYLNNKPKCAAAVRQWNRLHPSARRAITARFAAKPTNQLHIRVNKAIRKALGRAVSFGLWSLVLGYTPADLKRHLESLFTSGMTWDLFVRGDIHIDHRTPKSRFAFTSEHDAEFKACWALTNLQPMWAVDNLSKGARTMEEFEQARRVA